MRAKTYLRLVFGSSLNWKKNKRCRTRAYDHLAWWECIAHTHTKMDGPTTAGDGRTLHPYAHNGPLTNKQKTIKRKGGGGQKRKERTMFDRITCLALCLAFVPELILENLERKGKERARGVGCFFPYFTDSFRAPAPFCPRSTLSSLCLLYVIGPFPSH